MMHNFPLIKIVTISLSLVIFLLIVELIRREKLTFKYAFGWLVVSVLAIGLSVFDSIVYRVAQWFGFELASNFIFFALLAGFVFLSLFMTILLCQQNSHNDRMAQKIGILELEIKELRKSSSKQHHD